ncbi:MAG: pantoate--beta-alanine ligase [Planctomycetaceae bacterium]|nr:pantoate--beta-alanine ligase [Planctomycetaceae bacterium]
MIVASCIGDVYQLVQEARRQQKSVGVVPTMGALHRGHISLIERARQECDYVLTTIFVNPTQFGPNEDFSRYPRTLDEDLVLCRTAGADLVFTPSQSDMYDQDAQTFVSVANVADPWEGAHRPGHFNGVSTVVCKLFNITDPDRAYFGQKDYQQQLVIRQMVKDLNFTIEIVTCPIVREPDGLAMSSRNRYLTLEERTQALELHRALQLAQSLAQQPNLTPVDVANRMQAHLESAVGINLEYAVVADRRTLQQLHNWDAPSVALIAAKVGTTRLIDNMEIERSTKA